MLLKELNKEYDKLGQIYGAKELDSIYNGGLEQNPDICFVFMNPTKKILAAEKTWKGLKSPWIGTKNIWDLFVALNLLDKHIYKKIKTIKREEWTEAFAEEVYEDIKKHKYFITNLGKCTQIDARSLPNSVYKEYLQLLYKEFEIVKPKIIILFGNQVSSIVLDQKIQVSQVRKQSFLKTINNRTYKFYAVYYPIGNGRYNLNKAIEDIKWIIHENV